MGRLYLDGREIRGATPGDVVEADGVRFVFVGDDRPHLWSASGWTIERPV